MLRPCILRSGAVGLPCLFLVLAGSGMAATTGTVMASVQQECFSLTVQPWALIPDDGPSGQPYISSVVLTDAELPLGSATITSAEVRDIEIEHHCVRDLEVSLEYNGIRAVLTNSACSRNISLSGNNCEVGAVNGNFFDIRTSFINGAATADEVQHCNLRNRTAAVIRSQLGKFIGKPLGFFPWKLRIADKEQPGFGRLLRWTLRVCAKWEYAADVSVRADDVVVACPGATSSVILPMTSTTSNNSVDTVVFNVTVDMNEAHPDGSGTLEVTGRVPVATSVTSDGTAKIASSNVGFSLAGATGGVPAYRRFLIDVRWFAGSEEVRSQTRHFWILFSSSAATLESALSIQPPQAGDFAVRWSLNQTFAPASAGGFDLSKTAPALSARISGPADVVVSSYVATSSNPSSWYRSPVQLPANQSLNTGTSYTLELSPGPACSVSWPISVSFSIAQPPICSTFYSDPTKNRILASDGTVFSGDTISTTQSSRVVEVRSVNVKVEHTDPRQLVFVLRGPSGGTVELFLGSDLQSVQSCDDKWHVDATFVSTECAIPPDCQLTDGIVRSSVGGSLNAALGDGRIATPSPISNPRTASLNETSGEWSLFVRDMVVGTGGAFLSWSIELCADSALVVPSTYRTPPLANLTDGPTTPDYRVLAPAESAPDAGERRDFGNISETDGRIGVAIAIVATLLVVFCLVSIVFCGMKVRHDRNLERDEMQLDDFDATTRAEVRMYSSVKRSSTGTDVSDVDILERLGGGNFGDVYRGTWQGSTEVALKKLKSAEDVADFITEAKFLKKLHHPNIVQYFGIYEDKSTHVHYIVTEYMSLGSLDMFIRGKDEEEFSTVDLLAMARGAVSGMVYLEQQKLVHRDLSLRNLLASDQNGTILVKVADFGLARTTDKGIYQTDNKTMPVKWCAPESLQYGTFSHKSDVFAFGVMMWELLSYGRLPWAGVPNAEVVERVLSGKRLQKSRTISDDAYAIMQGCWDERPEKRFMFAELHKKISALLRLTAAEMEQSVPPTPISTMTPMGSSTPQPSYSSIFLEYSGTGEIDSAGIYHSNVSTPAEISENRLPIYMAEGVDSSEGVAGRTLSSVYMSESPLLETKSASGMAGKRGKLEKFESIYMTEDTDLD